MLLFWQFLYNLLFPIFWLIFKIIGLFNPKVRASLDGRKNLFRELKDQISKLGSDPKTRIWIHASSVGEFEQARPIMKTLKASQPNLKFIVTFSSISGYMARKKSPDIDLVSFLPLDFYRHAKQFISLINPAIFILIRYDFWFNHLLAAKKNGVKLFLISAVLQENAAYLHPLIKPLYKHIFHLFDFIFTSTEKDEKNYKRHFSLNKISKAGDPRFDQVIERSKNQEKVAYLKPYFSGKQVLVVGSSWQEDEQIIIPEFKRIKNAATALIIAPHEVHQENIERLQHSLSEAGFGYQTISDFENDFNCQNVLIIDQIGFLAELYSLATTAYVGGGFGVNVHNTLEAAVYGIPVLYGPHIRKSIEAYELNRLGGGCVARNQQEFGAALEKFYLNPESRQKAGKISGEYVRSKSGATKKISAYLLEELKKIK